MATVRLKPGREKPVRAGHPWLFSGAVAAIEPAGIAPGSPCVVVNAKGEPEAWGYVNPASQIVCRICGRTEKEAWGPELVTSRLERAAALRRQFAPADTDCIRLVNSEGDFLPGIVIDRYGDGFVLELTSAGAESMRQNVIGWLEGAFAPAFIYENSAGPSRGRWWYPSTATGSWCSPRAARKPDFISTFVRTAAWPPREWPLAEARSTCSATPERSACTWLKPGPRVCSRWIPAVRL
jgi:23S rRNA G2069 N7-methylase RlmK/C1962 C5-methylase RlmI